MKILVVSVKTWNLENAATFREEYSGVHEVRVFSTREDFVYDNVLDFDPDYIFIPHWSYFIPDEITARWECVVFHMTDLPFGRGGSPLQNLIADGYKETKISAIRVTGEIDSGPVYMKRELSLSGTAEEILRRASGIVFHDMIPYIIRNRPIPEEQVGEPVYFKRRKREDGELKPDMPMGKMYDYIRMLDGEGYPNAFLQFGDYALSFRNASFDATGQVMEATVRFEYGKREKTE